MSLPVRENKGDARPVTRTDRWSTETAGWLKAEAEWMTKEARMARAKALATTSGVAADDIYKMYEATGELRVLGPRVTVTDVLHDLVSKAMRG